MRRTPETDEKKRGIPFASKILTEERRAYVILVIISIVCSVLVALFTIEQVSDNDKKFCQIISASLAGGPVKQPANPAKAPAQEKLYENYIIVVDLGRSLGCHV